MRGFVILLLCGAPLNSLVELCRCLHMLISETGYIGGGIVVAATFASVICSIFLIHLIVAMGKWNGFTRIILWMTICQIVYDTSFVFGIYSAAEETGYKSMHLVAIFLSTFGGISVTLFTNVLMAVVFRMVYTRKAVKIMENFRIHLVLVMSVSIALAVYSTVAFGSGDYKLSGDLYNYVRLSSIVANFSIYAIVTKLLWTPTYKPLLVLSSRLKFYPICQVVTRLWPTIYEFIHGYNDDVPPTGFWSSFAFYLYCLFLPSAGIGYYVVFLVMQPQAYDKFTSLFAACCFCRVSDSRAITKSVKHFSSKSMGSSASSGADLLCPNIDLCESMLDRMLPSFNDMDEDELAQAIDQLNEDIANDVKTEDVGEQRGTFSPS